MMSNTSTVDLTFDPGLNDFSMRLRQLNAVFHNELKKTLMSKRAFIACALALIPLVMMLIMALSADEWGKSNISLDKARRIYGFIFSGLTLGAVVFLGSAAIFTALFRGEILGCSMHYYLLSPVRRELIVLGKYLAGLVTAWILFGGATLISYLMIYISFGSEQLGADISGDVFLPQLFSYLGISLLGFQDIIGFCTK